MSAGIKIGDDSIWLSSSEYTVSTDTYANTVQVKGKISIAQSFVDVTVNH